jgi:hypothetical protein
VFDGTRRGVDDGRRDVHRPVAWDDDTGDTGRFGGTKEGAEVLWVLEVVEDQDGARMFNDVVKRCVDITCCFERDTLMVCASGSLVKEDAGDDFDWQSKSAGGFEQAAGAIVLSNALGEEKGTETTAASEGFADRVTSIEQIAIYPGRFRTRRRSL